MNQPPKPTAKDVAQHMLDAFNKADGYLDQSDAVAMIEERFGAEFLYEESEGGRSISKKVLGAFRDLTPDVVYLRTSKAWRRREEGDEEGRQQEG